MIKYILLLAISLSACEADHNENPPAKKTSYKVLFIGNSYTFYNDGVDFYLQELLETDTLATDMKYIMESVTVGAYTLERHWGDPVTFNKLVSDSWDFVVLQEQSTRPINNIDLFYDYSRHFDTLIRKRQAETAFYMTWARKDQPLDITPIDAAYSSISEELHADLAPVGRAFEYVISNHPEISLHIEDNKHPTVAGTYLAACIFEITLFGKDPTTSTFVPSGLTAERAQIIRGAAKDFMKTWK